VGINYLLNLDDDFAGEEGKEDFHFDLTQIQTEHGKQRRTNVEMGEMLT
jgi:hypothetical protein